MFCLIILLKSPRSLSDKMKCEKIKYKGPVCGTNAVTYENYCAIELDQMFEKEMYNKINLLVIHEGKCFSTSEDVPDDDEDTEYY